LCYSKCLEIRPDLPQTYYGSRLLFLILSGTCVLLTWRLLALSRKGEESN
jgi:hypothetical protein